MHKFNSQSGFGVLGLILGMVVVLAVGGGAGYMYLKSFDEAPVDGPQELADFPGGNLGQNPSGVSATNTQSNANVPVDTNIVPDVDNQTDANVDTQVSQNILTSGEKKDCGVAKDGKDPAYECYVKAMAACSPAKLSVPKLSDSNSYIEYRVEGKSGANCVVSNPGGNIKTGELKLTLQCSFSDKLVPELLSSTLAQYEKIGVALRDKINTPYFTVNFMIWDKTLYEGSNKITLHSDGITKIVSDGTITCTRK